ncbi:thioredoxin reductase 1, cytoplasmic-like isoform X2 [Dermacentor andersoni]|uniref:thioredoxin reductase 1, cytoplasmic-like isoform X2 n=1 Tax=Dermacentor andersoni TaxID=34620 RepID=UPI002154FC60|nr:thioredoxin reductase 1, cytoplasmic-like isoform X2 [Dermacentor andersoni]
MPKLFPAICCHVSVEESALDIPPPSTASTVCSDERLLLALDREDGGDAAGYGPPIQEALSQRTGLSGVPQVFVGGELLGGSEDTASALKEGTLGQLLTTGISYDYDLVVIGGGSGGLAASKEAAKLGKKVAVCDFVKPTPKGTAWGLGGTCVNVGCIPKKLMHQAALLGQGIHDSKSFGWDMQDVKFKWETMRGNVRDYIASLNWKYRVSLREAGVDYINAYAHFMDPHKLKLTDKKGGEKFITSRDFLLAMGERPRYPDIPGAREYAISSDDLFFLPHCPGKTLVVGASYVALECAGFLRGIGLDVTVMVRSILLRGFDQDMAERIGQYMEKEDIRFIRPCVPTKLELIEEGSPGKIRVTANANGTEIVEEFNTVLFAVGREPCTHSLGLAEAGVNVNPKNGKLPAVNERTNVPHIYAVGDVLEGRPELTPVAIQAGILLARRLYGGSDVQCDYTNVPTTVFTPIEYGCIGYSEEDANAKFGAESIEVFHTSFTPLEWTLPKRGTDAGYLKIVCLIPENNRILGFHYLGPNAGEVTQGFATAMKLNATKADLDATIGIHPTCAELFTTLTVSKRSGASTKQGGC